MVDTEATADTDMGSARYSLRWNNHQNHLLNAFEGLLQNETLVDVTLVCEETTFKAHKVVLSACRYSSLLFHIFLSYLAFFSRYFLFRLT